MEEFTSQFKGTQEQIYSRIFPKRDGALPTLELRFV